MAVDIDMVRIASKGAYAPTSESDEDYIVLKAWALTRLNQDQPPAAVNDQCHALLIVHYYFAGDPKVGMKGFSSGDFSGSQDPGRTTWIIQYEQLCGHTTSTAELDTTRCDATMDDLKLDQNDVPTYGG